MSSLSIESVLEHELDCYHSHAFQSDLSKLEIH